MAVFKLAHYRTNILGDTLRIEKGEERGERGRERGVCGNERGRATERERERERESTPMALVVV